MFTSMKFGMLITLPSPRHRRHLALDTHQPALATAAITGLPSHLTLVPAVALLAMQSAPTPLQAQTVLEPSRIMPTLFFLMGNHARRTLQQNVNPNLFDLLAFLAQTTKLELEGYLGNAPHASVAFERGSYHVRLELSPCRIVECWILVAQVDCLDEPTFPCYNIQTSSISRDFYRSLLYSMLPQSEDGPVLALLPAVDCRLNTKPVTHSRPLAAEDFVTYTTITTASSAATKFHPNGDQPAS